MHASLLAEDSAGSALAFLGLITLFYLALFAFSVYLTVRIVRKAGFSGWWALLAFVPVVNVAAMVAFAFVEWPVESRVRPALGPAPVAGYGYGSHPAPAAAPAVPAPPAPVGVPLEKPTVLGQPPALGQPPQD